MSESLHSASSAAGSRGGVSLVKVGGALAIAGTIIGTFIFVLGCFGYSAAFAFSTIPLIMGALGLVLSIAGGAFQKPVGVEDTHVLASIVLNIAVVAGALLEIAIWLGHPIFAGGGH